MENGTGKDASPVLSDAGLTTVSPGVYAMTNNRFAYGGCMWISGYRPVDRNAYIQFDLGRVQTVDRFHVWNANEPDGYNARGFRDVTVQYSDDARIWETVAHRFRFAKAPGTDGYTGEQIALPSPIKSRYIRFIADTNYGGMNTGLSKVRFHAGGVAVPPPMGSARFPADSGIVNVRQSPYNAVGDGLKDDTDAIQRAIDDWQGTRQIIYLPAGTYLVSRSLRMKPGQRWGFTNIRGEDRTTVTLRLKDSTFTDPGQPQAVLDAAYNGTVPDAQGKFSVSADWFNNNFGHFTVDTGSGNPGAIGVRFYSNNVGAIRNVTIRSKDGAGVIGLDMGYVDQNGPLLAANIIVKGFDTGVSCGGAVNSQVLENISLSNQRVVGISNKGQCLSIRKLDVKANVTALDNDGLTTLVDSVIHPLPGTAKTTPAVISREGMFARNIVAQGFTTVIRNDFGGEKSVTTPVVKEFSSHAVVRLSGTQRTSLNLPIHDTPVAPAENPRTWANVREFRLTSDPDDSDAFQRAIDSGATTVYFPGQGTYYLSKTVFVRGKTRRILGMHSAIGRVGNEGSITVTEEAPATVWIEDIGNGSGGIELVNESSKTMVCRNIQDISFRLMGTGSLYLENVATGPLKISGQSVWARHLNIEGHETKIVNSGGTLSILGLKSEDGGTLIDTRDGGKTDLLGGLYYSQRGSFNDAPMFVNDNASVSASIAEVNYTNDAFTKVVKEVRGSETRILKRAEVPPRRIAPGNMLPRYIGIP